ncbi:MAG: glutamine synthetase III [Desulfosporosinus sp.]
MKIFGENVFNDAVMRERLPKATYKSLRKTIEKGLPLDPGVAEIVANAMKDWAIEKGATHFTHWFQPLTGITAEKHNSFISPTKHGLVFMDFSGKELIQGESDASSFPSGGIRATFEARGYTAWDCTSPAFLKKDADLITLCIPTAFCSYTGEALDEKTPLLRSMQALSQQALRIIRLFGNTTSTHVTSTVGAEQEYFLIDKKFFDKRLDLILTGRTLFGTMAPKGHELNDHYYGSLKTRVASFMNDLNTELWKLGVLAKTQHNEVAPAQFELAPIFGTTNVATDHNQLIMDNMKKIALKHDMVCLLHEKPFAGINGSGKHNNWSMLTDDGLNLLDPGQSPHENLQFLTIICAVVKAVDDYAELLRVSAANPGNDHRLGANEAPPAIISIYLGEQLTDIFAQIENGGLNRSLKGQPLTSGVITLPAFDIDSTDRNRTSPFAFTGNKFEFRMVASSQSIAEPNVVLNLIVAEVLSQFADRLEQADDFDHALLTLLQETITNHKRILFDGNGYSAEWVKEAVKRGLPCISSTVDAAPVLIRQSTIALFEKHKVLNRAELESRYEIKLEQYCKQINIEALTMIDIARHQITPAAIKYSTQLANSINAIKSTSAAADVSVQEALLKNICSTLASFTKNLDILEENVKKANSMSCSVYEKSVYYRDVVFKTMQALRVDGDKLETIIDADLWPLPTYAQMLFML